MSLQLSRSCICLSPFGSVHPVFVQGTTKTRQNDKSDSGPEGEGGNARNDNGHVKQLRDRQETDSLDKDRDRESHRGTERDWKSDETLTGSLLGASWTGTNSYFLYHLCLCTTLVHTNTHSGCWSWLSKMTSHKHTDTRTHTHTHSWLRPFSLHITHRDFAAI